MYGTAYPFIIYGFTEDSRDSILDSNNLEELGLSMFAIDVVRNYLGEAVYGIECEFCNETGKVVPPNKIDKKKVKDFYKLFMEYHEAKGKPRDSKLGYYLAVGGDYEAYAPTYWIE